MAEEEKKEFEQEHATLKQATTDHVSAETVDIVLGGANTVQADQVTLRFGAARDVRAKASAEIRQGAVATVNAEQVNVVQGAAGLVRSGKAELGPGSRSVAVLADTVQMDQAGAYVMVARESLEMEQSGAMVMVAPHVTARNSVAAVMFADKVDGDVRVLLDRPTAAVFGAALGAVFGLVLVLARLLRGGRKR